MVLVGIVSTAMLTKVYIGKCHIHIFHTDILVGLHVGYIQADMHVGMHTYNITGLMVHVVRSILSDILVQRNLFHQL